MIGLAAGFKILDPRYQIIEINKIDREPRQELINPGLGENMKKGYC